MPVLKAAFGLGLLALVHAQQGGYNGYNQKALMNGLGYAQQPHLDSSEQQQLQQPPYYQQGAVNLNTAFSMPDLNNLGSPLRFGSVSDKSTTLTNIVTPSSQVNAFDHSPTSSLSLGHGLDDISSPPQMNVHQLSDLGLGDGDSAITNLANLQQAPAELANESNAAMKAAQDQLSKMYAQVVEQQHQMEENKETIKQMKKMQERNEEILTRNKETVANRSKELVKLVQEYAEGLSLGSSSSGAAPPAFVEKLGRLKKRAHNGAF